jgi:hypothetical protein
VIGILFALLLRLKLVNYTLTLLPLAAIAVALAAQVPLDGGLVGHTAIPLVALVIALYSAGRHVQTGAGLAAAATCVVATSATRVVADPAVHSPGHAALTLVAVSLPLLVGRWVRNQALVRRGLALQARRLERDLARAARAAAEERLRQAGLTLNAQVPGRLLRERWTVPRASLALAERALERGSLSVRGFDRVLRVAWTLADLEGRPVPGRDEVAEALGMRLSRAAA